MGSDAVMLKIVNKYGDDSVVAKRKEFSGRVDVPLSLQVSNEDRRTSCVLTVMLAVISRRCTHLE